MKNLITTFAMILIAGSAQAAKTTHLTCDFTEPFVTLNVDLVKKSVTATSYNYENPKNPGKPGTILISNDIRIEGIGANPKFQNAKIYASDGALILTVSYSGAASNGMSDGIYPYDARWEALGQNTGACESNLLKAQEQFSR